MTALIAGSAQAETVRSATYEATAERRAVAMKATSGASIAASQVIIAVKRLDGQPVGPAGLGFAEQVACRGGKPLVSLETGAVGAGVQYEILCRTGG